MKKMIALSLCMLTAVMLGACGADPVVSDMDTISVQSYNGEKERVSVEVPADPLRVAVLDMPALDILDAMGLGERIVGSASVSIDYLKQYNPDDSDGKIVNLGTVKTADLEKVALSDPDVIFIGRRLASVYSELRQIAPVIYLDVDYEKGILESTRENTETIAAIFGMEKKVDALFADVQSRVDTLKAVMSDRNVLLAMYNGNALGLMDSEAQFNIITRELGARNLGETVGAEEKASHGEEASWETVIKLNPEYLFILDRNSAVGTESEGVREVVENDLIKELDVYKDDKIVYITDNANIWYTATGGVQAMNVMLTDLESALLN